MKIAKRIIAFALATTFLASCDLYYRPMQSRNIGRNNTSSHHAPGFR